MWCLVALALTGMPSEKTAVVTATFAAASTVHSSARAEGMRSGYAESDHFIVRSDVPSLSTDQTASQCESLYQQLQQRWFGRDQTRVWRPKCQVVIHATRKTYLRAVGAGGGQTRGSSNVRIRAGRVLERRIDLLVTDGHDSLSALPHELIHVLFAELFPDMPPPRWAEEGLALLNDPQEKRRRHVRDFHAALRSRTTMPLESFFLIANYPAGWQRAVFYGQSMSVVEYLVQLDSPDRFIHFVKLSMDKGHRHALQAVYDIHSLGDLERCWHQHARGSSAYRIPRKN